MPNVLSTFISNKTNLMVIQCILYFLIGWALKSYEVSITHIIIIYVLMIVISILNHLIGVSKGIFIATIHREELDTFMKILDEYEQNGEDNNEKDIN